MSSEAKNSMTRMISWECYKKPVPLDVQTVEFCKQTLIWKSNCETRKLYIRKRRINFLKQHFFLYYFKLNNKKKKFKK